MTIGRPPKYTDPQEMQDKIDEYFKECEKGKEVTIIRKQQAVTLNQPMPPTTAGLAVYLGFADRQSLQDYAKHNHHKDIDAKKSFSFILAHARTRIEQTLIAGAASGTWEPKVISIVLSTVHKYANKQELVVKPEADGLSDSELNRRIEAKLEAMGLTGDQPLLIEHDMG